MELLHWVRRENSGLFRTTIEIAAYEIKQGHGATLREPSDETNVFGTGTKEPDVEIVHSQLSSKSYYNNKPKFMFMHGEPLSSVGNKVSMKAIVDLAPKMDAFICLREKE